MPRTLILLMLVALAGCGRDAPPPPAAPLAGTKPAVLPVEVTGDPADALPRSLRKGKGR